MNSDEKKNWGEPSVETAGWKKSAALYLHDLTYMIIIAILVFLFVFRVALVSGDSMYSTLVDGDYLLLLSNVFYKDPEPGDIIVISKKSYDNGNPIIKRVIATEGQIVDIDFDNGIVYVDGIPIQEDYIENLTTLQEGMGFPLLVEEGCLFVMGDNRQVSKDSRSPEIGLIDTREVLGKAILLIYPGEDDLTGQQEFNRIGAVK